MLYQEHPNSLCRPASSSYLKPRFQKSKKNKHIKFPNLFQVNQEKRNNHNEKISYTKSEVNINDYVLPVIFKYYYQYVRVEIKLCPDIL